MAAVVARMLLLVLLALLLSARSADQVDNGHSSENIPLLPPLLLPSAPTPSMAQVIEIHI
jgi:hypothetical protein